MFRLLYDEIESYGKGHIRDGYTDYKPKYELSDDQVVDKEINANMLIEILNIIK